MRQFLLAVAPVALFAAGFGWLGGRQPPAMQGLGYMAPFAAIVTCVQALAGEGDLAVARLYPILC